MSILGLLLAGGCDKDEQAAPQTATSQPSAQSNQLIEPDDSQQPSEPVAGDVREAQSEVAAGDESEAEETGDGTSPDDPGDAPEEPAEENSLDGAVAYTANRCAMCHGTDREGTKMAPGLMNLKQFWTQADLQRYLAAPDVYVAGDERLQEVRKEYGKVTMPAFSGREGEAEAIARWLLSD